MPLLISTVVMFQAQNRETINSTQKVAVSIQDHYDDEHDKTVYLNKTPDLQDQDHSVQDQDRFVWSQTSLVLRLMVSDHIIEHNNTTSLLDSL